MRFIKIEKTSIEKTTHCQSWNINSAKEPIYVWQDVQVPYTETYWDKVPVPKIDYADQNFT